jgi:hypothetical protein
MLTDEVKVSCIGLGLGQMVLYQYGYLLGVLPNICTPQIMKILFGILWIAIPLLLTIGLKISLQKECEDLPLR